MNRQGSLTSSATYQVFMLVLCVYALGVLAVQTTVKMAPETASILDYADYAVCAMFFTDFVVSLVRAPNRWRYLATWGWLDLLSSIPTVDVARWGRAARVLRVFRVLRGLRATKLLASLILKRRAQSSILAASLVVLLLLVSCSIAVLHFEDDPASNIKSAEDAVWWAFVTITTVGYGDRFPVTSEGRLIGALLMSAGVGLFGVFSGFLAAWFLGSDESAPDKPDPATEIVALRAEIAALREMVGRLDLGTGPREGRTT
jgi:voltage-gated potassium channel